MDKIELVNLLKTDVARFNEYRTQTPNQERWDWRGIDLSGAKLKGADLRRIDLSEANFREADLREAQFGGSLLRGAVFQGAELTEANLHHCFIEGADLRRAKLTNRTRMGRLCVNLHSFEGVRWDKAYLEEILDIINQNQDWQIKYQIVPKEASPKQPARSDGSSSASAHPAEHH